MGPQPLGSTDTKKKKNLRSFSIKSVNMDESVSSVVEFLDSAKEIGHAFSTVGLDQDSVQKMKLLVKADWDRLYVAICGLCERPGDEDVKESICHWLAKFYQSRDEDLQRFCLQFIPIFAYVLLNSYAVGSFRTFWWLKALIASMYNSSVSDEKAKPKTQTFRVLPLNYPSYYHEPIGFGPNPGLTETALRKLEPSSPKLVTWGPHEHIDSLTMSNLPNVIGVLLRFFNQHLGLMSQKTLLHTCTVIQRIASQGFVSQSSEEDSFEPRLPLLPLISTEFLRTVYFASFNPGKNPGDGELTRCATLALEALHSRALRDLNSDLIVMTTAARHSIPRSRESGNVQPSMFNVANKTIITNASFRTKKHAEDIPIQEPSETKDGRTLSSISEEGDEQLRRAKESGPRASIKETKEKFKITDIGLMKKKEAARKSDREARKSESDGKKVDAKENKKPDEAKTKKNETAKRNGSKGDIDGFEMLERKKENATSDRTNRKSGDYSSLANGSGI